MLLVTLLFVLTTRGVKLDHSTYTRAETGAELPSPTLLPLARRASSVLLQPETESQPILGKINEYGKRKRSWAALNRAKRIVHSAPATPASLSRSWTSPRTTLSRYPALSDEDMALSDSDYTERRLRSFGRGSDDEFQETLPKTGSLDTDYPALLNNGEMYE